MIDYLLENRQTEGCASKFEEIKKTAMLESRLSIDNDYNIERYVDLSDGHLYYVHLVDNNRRIKKICIYKDIALC